MIVLLISVVFVLVVIIISDYKFKMRHFRQRNKVHFYVARDKNGGLWLYLNKPVRTDSFFSCSHGQILSSSENFSKYDLNVLDYTNLKWEDEPIEVFINIKD